MILRGDCHDRLKDLDNESVDAVITDPPYNLAFMGRDWDRHDTPLAFQEWCQAWAEQCLRVLKPGGYLLAFGGTRTYHRLATGIEDAGFEMRDCLSWNYGSGFPKSQNLSGDREGWGTALKPAHEPIVMARKPFTGTVAENVAEFGTGSINIDGCRIGTSTDGQSGEGRSGKANPRGHGACELHGLRRDDAQVEVKYCESEVAADLQPEVPGQTNDRAGESPLPGEVGRETLGLHDGPTGPAGRGDAGAHSEGAARGSRASGDNGGGAGALAEGSGACPPHQRRQTGQPVGKSDADGLGRTLSGTSEGSSENGAAGSGEQSPPVCTCERLGRWPANVLLDEQAAEMLDEQAGEARSAGRYEKGAKGGANDFQGPASIPIDGLTAAQYDDAGGPSRFFFTAQRHNMEGCVTANTAEQSSGPRKRADDSALGDVATGGQSEASTPTEPNRCPEPTTSGTPKKSSASETSDTQPTPSTGNDASPAPLPDGHTPTDSLVSHAATSEPTGTTTTTPNPPKSDGSVEGAMCEDTQKSEDHGGRASLPVDTGAVRFRYVAKASSAEKNAGLVHDLPNDRFRTRRCLECGKNVPEPGACGCDALIEWVDAKPTRNPHPTVKPIDLMRWLVRLVTPPDGVILDPFAGSGTTGIAAGLELAGFIGIERDPEYADIADARIEWWSAQSGETVEILRRAGLAEKAVVKHRERGQLDLLADA
jgi:DNA modification methylase